MAWTAIVRHAASAVGSNAELARLIDVNRSQVGRWIEGVQRPRPAQCRAIDDLALQDASGDPLPSLEVAIREDVLSNGALGPLVGGEVLTGRQSYTRLTEHLHCFIDEPPAREQRVVTHGAWHASGPKAPNLDDEQERWRFIAALNRLVAQPRREGWVVRYMASVASQRRLEEIVDRLWGPWKDSSALEVRLFVGTHPPVMSPLVLGQRVAAIAVDDPAMHGVEDSLLLTDPRAVAVVAKSAMYAWDSATFRIRTPAGPDEDQLDAARRALAETG